MSEFGPVTQVKKFRSNPLWCSVVLMGTDGRRFGAWDILLRLIMRCQ